MLANMLATPAEDYFMQVTTPVKSRRSFSSVLPAGRALFCVISNFVKSFDQINHHAINPEQICV